MNYVNKLSSNELRELFEIFIETSDITDFRVWTTSGSVVLSGVVCRFEIIQQTYKCVFDDYTIVSNIHSSIMKEDLENVRVFREYMLKKFGENYAVTYLLNDFSSRNGKGDKDERFRYW